MPRTVSAETPAPQSFADLGLSEPLVAVLDELGYEAPTPIQRRTIPALLAGRDVIGQAQTGTGKTAAFALPILERLDYRRAEVQALVLTPTRELSIQVAEAVHVYARKLAPVRVLPIYGGQSIQPQLRSLSRGVHVVIGTPGRVMDHLRRGSLGLDGVSTFVLDEADEMLRMGFIDDVEWIMSQAPADRQTALFSATMPEEIRRIARRHLRDPLSIEIEHATRTVLAVDQRYLNVSERQKLDALTRILGAEAGAATLVFARTKTGAADLAERLAARGHSVEALHGDMSQAAREAVVRRLRAGQVEVVVATDVAARGLDVERVERVVNYDVPYDPESYVHRIGRTGRAGRGGVAILFVTPREQRLLREIERFTRHRMTPMALPTLADVAARRVALLKETITKTIADENLELYLTLVEELAEEGGLEMAEIAAAAARLAHGEKPLATEMEPEPAPEPEPREGRAPHRARGRDRAPAADGAMVRLFIDAGRSAGVRPNDIVGAIANEAGVPGRAIGAIDIYDRFAFVEVPAEYEAQVLDRMARTTLRSRPIRIKPAAPASDAPPPARDRSRRLDGRPRRPGSRTRGARG
jgi:ATP-dependent RNA helicase DeaD